MQKFYPVFVTDDGVTHEGSKKYNWINVTNLDSARQFLTCEVESIGHIFDEHEVQYLIKNVVSIKWELLDEKVVIDKDVYSHRYQRFYSNKEINDMEEYKESNRRNDGK